MPLVLSVMAMTLLTALGSALVIGTMIETAIAAGHRESAEVFYAADAAVAFAIAELATADDWNAVLSGTVPSVFVDGAAVGTRRVGATTIDLAQATEDTNTAASGGDVTYRLYAYGRFADMAATGGGASPYVIVWLADVPVDEADPEPGARVLGIVGRAYGPRGSRRSVAVSLARVPGADGDRVRSWHELR